MSKKSKSDYDINELVEILRDSISLYREGRQHQYRVIAIVLRALLCDKKPLFERVYPEVKFHRLIGKNENPFEGLDYRDIRSHKSATWSGLPFHRFEDKLQIKDWLNQALFTETITIRRLIKSVADRELAHADEDYDETLRMTYMFHSPFKGYSHQEYIFYLGEYILYMLNVTSSGTISKSAAGLNQIA